MEPLDEYGPPTQRIPVTQQATLDQELGRRTPSQFGNGLLEVGRDIKAGVYHSSGAQAGTQCSWGLPRTENPTDVAAQGTSGGPQTVTINVPFFSSHGCGTWTKVG
jgi:hypothetical protein